MENQLIQQIELAMQSNPGRSLLDLIDDVCSRTFATRKYNELTLLVNMKENWNLTNDDLLKAFTRYNETKGK